MSPRSQLRTPGAWGRPWGRSRRAPVRGRRLQRRGGWGTVERCWRGAPCAAGPATVTHPHAAPARAHSARNSPGQVPDRQVPPSSAARNVTWTRARLMRCQSPAGLLAARSWLGRFHSVRRGPMRQQVDACGQAHRVRLGAAPAAQALRAPPPLPSAARSARPQPGPLASAPTL